MCRQFSICVVLLLLCETAFAQSPAHEAFDGYVRFLTPEKLYLHNDREVYNIGDTIWFRGYLRNASSLAEYPECNYLYVELFSSMWEKNWYSGRSEETYKMRKRIKVKRGADGLFCGYLPSPKTLTPGVPVCVHTPTGC